MLPSRRLLLALVALGASGCVSSPRVAGGPASAPVSPPPTLSPAQAAAAAAVHTLSAAVAKVDSVEGWRQGATAQLSSLLERVNSLDPLSRAPQSAFALPEPGVAELTAAAEIAAEALEACAGEATDGATRLAYASAAAAALSLRQVGPVPVEDTAVPHRLPQNSLDEAATIALGHAWALIYGLGVGLGRLPADDPTHALATAQLAVVREMRNELRDTIDGDVAHQPAAFELPTPMDSVESIRAGLAKLELNLLAGYAGLVAADPDARWRARMRELALAVQAFGGGLPYWPGWTA